MIKRIELINFMSHQHSVIEPDPGLTVLCGPNNCGKSAVVVALQILCHNDKSNFVLRHEEKNCRIIVETSEGHTIEWSRKKNGSAKYIIDGVLYDRLGGKAPPALYEVLRLPRIESKGDKVDVHFGEQKQPVFLLNDSKRTAADFFASSSDATRLMEMQSLHKTKVKDARRDQTRLETELADVEEALELLKPVESLEKQLEHCEQNYAEIAAVDQDIESLEHFLADVESASKKVHFQECEVACLSSLAMPPAMNATSELEELLLQMEATTSIGEIKSSEATVLQQLQPPPELADESELATLISELAFALRSDQIEVSKQMVLAKLEPCPELPDLAPLTELLSEMNASHLQLKKLDSQIEGLAQELVQTQKGIAAWAEENPVCPTCGGPVELERLVSLDVDGGDHD